MKMVSMMQIKKNYKRNSAMFMIICILSCVKRNDCSDFEQKIESVRMETDSLYNVPLRFLENSEWEYLFIIQGPRMEGEISQITKVEYRNILQDDYRLFIFMKNGKIAHEFLSSCRVVKLDRILEDGSIKLRNSDCLNFELRKNVGGVYIEAIPNVNCSLN